LAVASASTSPLTTCARRSNLVRVFVLSLLLMPGVAGAEEWRRVHAGTAGLEYRLQGVGEPVVFIHAGVIAGWFEPLVSHPTLREAYTLLTYHRVGYAGSSRVDGNAGIADQARQLAALLRHAGLERVHLVGHSSGALIAIQLALDEPGSVRSLTLLEAALPIAGTGSPGIASAISIYQSGNREAAIDAFLRAVAGDEYREIVDRALPGAIRRAALDADTFFEHELPAVRKWTFETADAHRLRMPVLVVVGGRSAEISPIWRQRHEHLMRLIPRAQSFVLPGATHLLHLENADAMAERLADFVAPK
jgi:pimeloyl-ACP methyl ester carboxylesterase